VSYIITIIDLFDFSCNVSGLIKL